MKVVMKNMLWYLFVFEHLKFGVKGEVEVKSFFLHMLFCAFMIYKLLLFL
jgi:hypothetical protein